MNTLTPSADQPLPGPSSNEFHLQVSAKLNPTLSPKLSGGLSGHQNLAAGSSPNVDSGSDGEPSAASVNAWIDQKLNHTVLPPSSGKPPQKCPQMLFSENSNSGSQTSRMPNLTPQSDALPAMMQVLVVEDEPEIRQLIALHLKREGLKVDTAGSAEEAVALIEKQSYGLLLLDWMLPGASGLDITRSIRRRADRDDLAILMVTARAEATDIVMGLEAGADDYLTKPFEPAVLLARVRALMRRHRRTTPESIEKDGGNEVLRAGNLALYPAIYEVKCGDETLSLTPSEFKLLTALIQNRGRVMTRDSLIGCVQGEGVSVVGRTVDTHVFGLRKKLGACSEIIETVRGVGYRVRPFES